MATPRLDGSEVDEFAFDLGQAIATAVARAWLPKPGAQQEGLAGVLEVNFASSRDRRRIGRTLERIGDEVAESLRPLLASLGPELGSAVVPVIEALSGAPAHRGIAKGRDLDPFALERKLTEELIQVLGQPKVSSVHARLLAESTDYIVALTSSLPETIASTGPSRSRVERELLDLTHSVIERLPQRDLGAPFAEADFETRYRREIVRKLDRLVLFGLTVAEDSRRYPLSVAYISLKATEDVSSIVKGDAELASTPSSEKAGSSVEANLDDARVETAVVQNQRLLLRGEAGSGKTTLLQYLAVQCGSGRFAEPLDALESAVPFLLQLRRFGDSGLPQPEDFLKHLMPEFHNVIPLGWITEQMESGRALLLVDGVDEVPSEERDAARSWLADLCSRFPKARCVVTSRPPAVDAGWLAPEGFVAAELEPMGVADIESFIRHWHDAAREEAGEEADRLELDRLQSKLIAAVKSSRPIRGLATSPLLCAMLCALNRDRRSQLPDDRQELYRIALETLLDRRDVERELPSFRGLGFRPKVLLLAHLAYWLMDHGRTDVSRSQAQVLVGDRAGEMAGIDGNQAAVFDFLLERSGLLREPIAGRIDFIHRTFQEYLAAFEVVDRDATEHLVGVAHLDQWREVVILAAGQARRGQREALIEGLLDRGDAEQAQRSRLHLLAVACLENSPELSSELVERLQSTLRRLVPPTTMTQAKALASAGELAVPLLAEFHGSDTLSTTVAACVRSLSVIGGEQSQLALARFGLDRRITVHRELIRGWGNFDSVEYARTVLADSPFPRGLRVHVTSDLTGIQYLKHLRELEVAGGRYRGLHGEVVLERLDLGVIASRRNMRRLEIAWLELPTLAPLGALRELRSLAISGCTGFNSIDALASLHKLSDLRLRGLSDVSNLEPLSELASLRNLELSGVDNVGDLSPAAMPNIEKLTVGLPPSVRELDWLGTARNLTELRIQAGVALEDVSALASLTQLETAWMDAPNLRSVEALGEIEALKSVHVVKAHELVTFPATWRSVREITLNSAGQLNSLSNLGSAPELRELRIFHAPLLQSLSGIENAPELTRLSLAGSRNLRDVSSLADLSKLRDLLLIGCESLEDIAPLRGCAALEHVDLERCVGIRSVAPLIGMPNLKSVDITGLNVDGVEQLRAEGVDVYPYAAAQLTRASSG